MVKHSVLKPLHINFNARELPQIKEMKHTTSDTLSTDPAHHV